MTQALRSACLLVFCALLLPACAARGPVLSSARTELVATPFHPQARYQCGPAALASVLGATDVRVTPEELAPRVYLPGRRGSLQLEMLAAVRDFGRLSLTLPRHLEAIVAELEAGRPVLVLHNYGRWLWPRWHYAVVVGYDPDSDSFVLRSGREARRRMRTRHFMVYWHHAGRWAMVVLRPGETAAGDDPKLFLEVAAEFERHATADDARAAFDAAVKRWPQEPVGWIGRGTAEYSRGDRLAAARDYASALELDASNPGARNNLAQVLLDLGCARRARFELEGIESHVLPADMRDAVAATQAAARAVNASSEDAAACAAIP